AAARTRAACSPSVTMSHFTPRQFRTQFDDAARAAPAQWTDSNAMHIHILGICGTFMGGLAVLRAVRVTRSRAATPACTRR
ncbi:hypothetical protein, partial [Mycetohabitans sp. B46]|uniref:hypothetical protein n=1 Tax=Mycetohabitans sp. B46 TaxID=2772536 RepID=UPI00307CF5C2